MEKSIEKMWSNGFLKNEELLVPKINNLYNQKSQLFLEKFKRTYEMDNKGLIPLALLSGLGFGFTGHILLGIYLMLLMLALFFFNSKKINALERIKINESSYDYLVEYRKTIREIIGFYTKLAGIGMPVATMIGYYLYFRNTVVLDKITDLTHLYQVLIVSGIALVLSGLGVGIYRLVTKMIYGKLLKKLNELIEDMNELRSQE